jgi:hypothetical protein
VAPVEVTVGVAVTDATLFGTVEVYDKVPDENVGVSDPRLSTRESRVLTVLIAATLLTVTEYVLTAIPSCAVTTMVMTVSPTLRLMGLDVLPDVTGVPCTVTVAAASVVVGVTLTDGTPFTTLVVYDVVPGTNVGASEP